MFEILLKDRMRKSDMHDIRGCNPFPCSLQMNTTSLLGDDQHWDLFKYYKLCCFDVCISVCTLVPFVRHVLDGIVRSGVSGRGSRWCCRHLVLL